MTIKIENYTRKDGTPDFYAIMDTDHFIDSTLDKHELNDIFENCDHDIDTFLECNGYEKVDGLWTGNNENSLSSNFGMEAWVKKDDDGKSDWFYAQTLILVIDDIIYEPNGNSETGYLDWTARMWKILPD